MPHHMRPHRGGVRFGGPPRMRPDFNNEIMHEANERFQKRSRWGDFDNNREEQQQENAPPDEEDLDENKGCNTPLHDEPFNREFAEAPAAIQSNQSEPEVVVQEENEKAPVVEEGSDGGENDTTVTE